MPAFEFSVCNDDADTSAVPAAVVVAAAAAAAATTTTTYITSNIAAATTITLLLLALLLKQLQLLHIRVELEARVTFDFGDSNDVSNQNGPR